MKTLALLTLAAALVGCSRQGGSTDDYNTESGRSSTNNPVPQSTSSLIDTNNTNQGVSYPPTRP